MTRQITISVTEDEARKIEERVAAGDFESPEDLVRAALTLFEFGSEPDWMPPNDVLRRLVDEAVNDPRPSLTPEQVHRELLDLHDRSPAGPDKKIAR